MKKNHSILGVLSVLLIVTAGCGGGGSSPTSLGGLQLAEVEHGSYQLINEERAEQQVSPRLGRDPMLDDVARSFSEQMRDEGFFGHKSPSGETVAHRLKARGYGYRFVGENVARVKNAANPAGFAHSLLMESPSHRRNILSSKYRKVGVGVAMRGDTVWITQVYVQP